MFIKYVAVALMGLAAAVAQAQAPTARFFANVAYSLGGDTLASGTFVSGNTWDIRAGQGLVLALGADFRVAEKVVVRASVGQHADDVRASNGVVSFTRRPLELLGFYELNSNVMLGGGLRQSGSARVKASGVAKGLSAAGDYDSSTGLVVEGVYFFSPLTSAPTRKPLWGMNLRFVTEEFKQSGKVGATEKSGNHVALGLVFMY